MRSTTSHICLSQAYGCSDRYNVSINPYTYAVHHTVLTVMPVICCHDLESCLGLRVSGKGFRYLFVKSTTFPFRLQNSEVTT